MDRTRARRSGGRRARCCRRSTPATTRRSGASRRRSCSISRGASIRAHLADIRYEHLLFAEEFRLGSKARVLEERLAAVDTRRQRRRKALAAPGTLALRTAPAAAAGRARALRARPGRPAAGSRSRSAAIGAGAPTTLPPGSYRLSLDGPGLAHVVYPFEVARGRAASTVDLTLPPRVGGSRRLRLRPAGRVLVRRRATSSCARSSSTRCRSTVGAPTRT